MDENFYEIDGTLIDAVDMYIDGKIPNRIKTQQGYITFYNGTDIHKDGIYIHYIFVNEHLRHQGIFKSLINHLICKKSIVGVLGVGNPYIIECFQNKTFFWKKVCGSWR